jgi:hypothetical protein
MLRKGNLAIQNSNKKRPVKGAARKLFLFTGLAKEP